VVASLQEAAFLKGGDQPMDAGLGLELQRILHLFEAGGETGFPQVSVDEHKQLVLFACEHGGVLSPMRAAAFG
jgi:hypothetical protein